MKRRNYSPVFKTELVLELLQGEKELGALAAEHQIRPNLLRNEFLENTTRLTNGHIQWLRSQSALRELDPQAMCCPMEGLSVEKKDLFYNEYTDKILDS